MLSQRSKIICISLIFICLLAAGIYLYASDGSEAPVNHPRPAAEAPAKKRSAAPVAEIKPDIKPAPAKVARIKKTAAAADSASKNTESLHVSYPEEILDLLDVDRETVIAERDAFKDTIVHMEWMDHVSEVLEGLDPEKKAAIIKNHTTLLYLKDRLNTAYLKGEIDHETFTNAVAELMKWHQKTFTQMIDDAEYEDLFEVKPEMAEDMIDDLINSGPRYGYILNPNITPDEVTKRVQGYKLEEVDSHFRKMIYTRDQLGKQINAGEIDLAAARKALYESQQEFIAKCKELLTEEEIKTIFGSMAALETGQTQTDPPAVIGDTDLKKLGFRIENPDTSIEKVREDLDKEKIEDVEFFYQQRAKERKKVLDKLNAGEMETAEMENISREMDAAFEENCRSVLTEEEYQLIFKSTSDAADADEPEKLPTPGDENITESEMGEAAKSAKQIIEDAENRKENE